MMLKNIFNKPHNGARKTYYRLNIEKGEKFEKFVLKKFETKDYSI